MASLVEYAFAEPPAFLDKVPPKKKNNQQPTFPKMSIIEELYQAEKALGESMYSPRSVALAIPDLSGRKRPFTEDDVTAESARKSKLRCKLEPLTVQSGGGGGCRAGGDATLAAVCSAFTLDELTEPLTPPHSATTTITPSSSLSICSSAELSKTFAAGRRRCDLAKVCDYADMSAESVSTTTTTTATATATATPVHKEEVTLTSAGAGDDFTNFKLEESVASMRRRHHKVEPFDEDAVKKCGGGLPSAPVVFPTPTREEAAIARRARRELRKNRRGVKVELGGGGGGVVGGGDPGDRKQGSASSQCGSILDEVDKKAARAIRNREAALKSRMEAKQKMLSLERENASLSAKVQLIKAENLRLKHELSGLAREMIASANKNFTSLKDFFKSFEGL